MKPKCLLCNEEMKLDKKVSHKYRNGTYRIRRFSCALCGTFETIYADGGRDMENDPQEAVEEAKKLRIQ